MKEKCISAIREPIEWVSVRWHDEKETQNWPRVLLVGDSIVVGHGTSLHNKMKSDKIAVDWFATSKIVSDVDYMSDLEFMLAKYKYEIIIFNNGLHGGEVSDKVYAGALKNVLAALMSRTQILAWRNNTPCFPMPGKTPDSPWIKHGVLRNSAVLPVVVNLNLPVIDAYEILKDKGAFSADGVHFKPEGYEFLVEIEAQFIKENITNTYQSEVFLKR